MKYASRITVAFLALQVASHGQTTQPPANPDELNFFHYLLMTLGSIDYGADFIKNTQDSVVRQFGLSGQEASVIQSAAQSLHTTLLQIRQSANSIIVGKVSLSSSDLAALSALTAQRDQQIATLANSILNSVSTATAVRLRFPGNLVAGTINQAKAKNP
jgi:hypothetical protein